MTSTRREISGWREVVLLAQYRSDLATRGVDRAWIGDLNHDGVDRGRPEEAYLRGQERDPDDVVLVASGAEPAFAGQHANDRDRHVANPNLLADE
jgi:hypothetical protein